MAIPYRTAKFKSANSLAIAILGSTAKFNSRQYFWLYGIIIKQVHGVQQYSHGEIEKACSNGRTDIMGKSISNMTKNQ